MNCARCGNALHRIPMFDLPRKVKEFSCMCCGERFWTTQGEASVFSDPDRGPKARRDIADVGAPILEFTAVPHHN